MTHHDAFLEAILAEPDSDDIRLIYADWLSDNGDPDRANLIRWQCASAIWRSGCDCNPAIGTAYCYACQKLRVLNKQIREVLRVIGLRETTWLRDLLGTYTTGDLVNILNPDTMALTRNPVAPVFTRGLIEHLVLPAHVWIWHGDELLKRTPLRDVWLYGKSPEHVDREPGFAPWRFYANGEPALAYETRHTIPSRVFQYMQAIYFPTMYDAMCDLQRAFAAEWPTVRINVAFEQHWLTPESGLLQF